MNGIAKIMSSLCAAVVVWAACMAQANYSLSGGEYGWFYIVTAIIFGLGAIGLQVGDFLDSKKEYARLLRERYAADKSNSALSQRAYLLAGQLGHVEQAISGAAKALYKMDVTSVEKKDLRAIRHDLVKAAIWAVYRSAHNDNNDGIANSIVYPENLTAAGSEAIRDVLEEQLRAGEVKVTDAPRMAELIELVFSGEKTRASDAA